jgi:hypothetical protein
VGVGGLELPPDVLAKRLSTWQVEWRNRIAQETVGADIEAQRIYQQARARAQVENIRTLLLSIEEMRRQSGIELQEVIMLRLTEVLESLSAARALAAQPAQAAIASQVIEATSELRQLLARGGE